MKIKFLNNLKTQSKLFIAFAVLGVLMIIIALVGIVSLNKVNNGTESLFTNSLVPIEQLGTVESTLLDLRANSLKYMLLPEERVKILAIIEDSKASISAAMDSAREVISRQTNAAGKMEAFDIAYANYLDQVDAIIQLSDAGREKQAVTLAAEGGALVTARNETAAAIDDLKTLNFNLAQAILAESDSTYQSSFRIMLILGIFSLLLSTVLVFLMTDNINKPLKLVTAALGDLQVGHIRSNFDKKVLEDTINRKDEFGELLRATLAVRKYIIAMSRASEIVAKNDLTVNVAPLSENDVLGNSFKKMVVNLRNTISSVTEATAKVAATSNGLAIASNQAGQATGQIATTIQQVANGITQQSDSVAQMAASIEQVNKTIEEVAAGATEQASAVGKANSFAGNLSVAIGQVAGNAASVVKDSAQASDAAKRGAETVDQTLNSMRAIKSAVGLSAGKVQEMGSRSEQIGSIVTTIEDIASQTNLLALNAAIEAARAGDSGKGFAVVADEIRKLAERSSISTREISDLIKAIQNTVAEAVIAMDQGAKEVETGVELAGQAGNALKEILNANKEVSVQAELAAKAAGEMSSAAGQLVSAADSVSSVVEQNTAATEEMSASSTEIIRAVENVASVSEENSAAVEEVSASAEEMTAQVEEVSASAQELAALAESLEQVVSAFKVA